MTLTPWCSLSAATSSSDTRGEGQRPAGSDGGVERRLRRPQQARWLSSSADRWSMAADGLGGAAARGSGRPARGRRRSRTGPRRTARSSLGSGRRSLLGRGRTRSDGPRRARARGRAARWRGWPRRCRRAGSGGTSSAGRCARRPGPRGTTAPRAGGAGRAGAQHLAGHLADLLGPPGDGDPDAMHVVADVEVGVVDPHRPVEAERDLLELPPELRCQRDAPLDVRRGTPRR